MITLVAYVYNLYQLINQSSWCKHGTLKKYVNIT